LAFSVSFPILLRCFFWERQSIYAPFSWLGAADLRGGDEVVSSAGGDPVSTIVCNSYKRGLLSEVPGHLYDERYIFWWRYSALSRDFSVFI
jgi:hypothetical protein